MSPGGEAPATGRGVISGMRKVSGPRRASSNRRRVAVLTAGAVAIVMSACGGSNDSSSPAAGGSKEFAYWSMWKQGEPQQRVLQTAIDAFTAETGIKVEVQWQGRDVIKKLTPALNTNKVPDLVDQDGNTVKGGLVVNEQHRDLSGVYRAEVPGEGAKVSDVVPSKFVDLVRDQAGKPFMVPYEVISSAIWFDASQNRQLAEDPPATFEEFKQLLDEVKAGGKAPLALDGDIGFYNSYWTYWALIRTLGPGKLNELAADESGEAWRSPEVIEALRAIESLVTGGYFIDGYQASKWPAVQQKWSKREAEFLLMGTWAPSETAPTAAKGFEYDSFQFPALGSGGFDSAEAGVIGFAIPAKAEHADAAEKFMAYFLAKDRLAGIAQIAKNLTPREDVAVPPELASTQKAIKSRELHRLYDGIDADFPDYPTKVFEPINNELLYRKISAEQFVEKIAKAQSDYWKLQG